MKRLCIWLVVVLFAVPVLAPVVASAEKAKDSSKENEQVIKDIYTCPDVMSDKPGKCPQCGKALVKVGKEVYTCPDEISDKPGKCPQCGMNLIKVENKKLKGKSEGKLQKMKMEKKNKAGKAVYTCPMHPDVVSDKPGQCPKCGMNLIKVEKDKTKK